MSGRFFFKHCENSHSDSGMAVYGCFLLFTLTKTLGCICVSRNHRFLFPYVMVFTSQSYNQTFIPALQLQQEVQPLLCGLHPLAANASSRVSAGMLFSFRQPLINKAYFSCFSWWPNAALRESSCWRSVAGQQMSWRLPCESSVM